MKPEPEELIRQLAEVEEDEATPTSEVPTVGQIEAYRTAAKNDEHDEHDENDEAVERLERQLAASPTKRELLSASAAIELPRPSDKVRAATLAAAPRPRAVRGNEAPSLQPPRLKRSRRTRRWVLWVGAAAAAAILAFGIRPLRVGTGGADTLPSYEATISGLAEVRSGAGPEASVATAYPSTPIEISAAPLDEGRSGVDIGLYRREGDSAVRVDTAPGVSIEASRGAVVFRSSADALTASSEAGTWDLYVVAARAGDLPTSLAVPSGQSPFEALSASGRRRVEALQLIVRPSP